MFRQYQGKFVEFFGADQTLRTYLKMKTTRPFAQQTPIF